MRKYDYIFEESDRIARKITGYKSYGDLVIGVGTGLFSGLSTVCSIFGRILQELMTPYPVPAEKTRHSSRKPKQYRYWRGVKYVRVRQALKTESH